jgi:hypothetical protein
MRWLTLPPGVLVLTFKLFGVFGRSSFWVSMLQHGIDSGRIQAEMGG